MGRVARLTNKMPLAACSMAVIATATCRILRTMLRGKHASKGGQGLYQRPKKQAYTFREMDTNI